jgi:hypothetical protein
MAAIDATVVVARVAAIAKREVVGKNFIRLIELLYGSIRDTASTLDRIHHISTFNVFQNGTDFYEFLARSDIPSVENDASFTTRILTAEGYDAIEVRGIPTLVIILNSQQIAVYDRESTT